MTSHPSFNPLIDIRARIYDIGHDPARRGLMTIEVAGERFAVALKPARTAVDWHAKRLQLTA